MRDGTPHIKTRADDVFGLQQGLLRSSSIVPSGTADTAVNSQYLQSIVELASGRANIYDETGVVNAYVATPRANQQAPASLFDGLTIRFSTTNTNTGVSTLDAFGSGAKPIKNGFTGNDLAGGEIKVGEEHTFLYSTDSGGFWKLTSVERISENVIARIEVMLEIAIPGNGTRRAAIHINGTNLIVALSEYVSGEIKIYKFGSFGFEYEGLQNQDGVYGLDFC